MAAHAKRRSETALLPVSCGADLLICQSKEMRLDIVSESASEARPVPVNEYTQEHFSRAGRGDAGFFAMIG